MNMIEVVTNAIRDSFNSNDIDCYPIAKAAIEAMREPTEDMKQAGSLDPGAGGPDGDYSTEVWQAMIDEALKE